MSDLTRSQLDRLGRRIRSGELTDADIASLEEAFAAYSHFGAGVFADVVACIGEGGTRVAGMSARDVKSMTSIREKLLRRPMHLSDMQDIVGCRVIVPSLSVQDEAVSLLERALSPERIIEHRNREGSNGYRAVHVIAKRDFRRYEIQVRTRLQNDWAMLVECLIPVHGISVKYGEAAEPVQRALRALSDVAYAHELRVRSGQDAGFSLLPSARDAFSLLLANVGSAAAVGA